MLIKSCFLSLVLFLDSGSVSVDFCLWCGKVVPKLFVCIVQLLVIP